MSERREELVNNAQTTLNGGIGASDTSIVVANALVFPGTGNFRLLLESELVLCTAVSGNTLTVVRAQEGTANVAHAAWTSPVRRCASARYISTASRPA